MFGYYDWFINSPLQRRINFINFLYINFIRFDRRNTNKRQLIYLSRIEVI